tara:strand:+ start:9293 stop:9628 length:336 start_codon:yes stop_codon:yes gene_type:complete
LKKKIAIVNLGLVMVLIFALCYQSLHVFSHAKYNDFDLDSSKSNKNISLKIVEKQHCAVCDFTFASFLSPAFFTFKFIPFYQTLRHLISIPENVIAFGGSLYSLRGPPCFM